MVEKNEPPQQASPKKKQAFVVSPIGTPGTDVHRNSAYALKYIFKRALDPHEWEVHRADEGTSPDSINQHVIRSIYNADLIIADLTGHNPNVFYELAVAHGIRKPVVHLLSEGENLPFDIIDMRTIFYDITDLASVERTVDTLARYAGAAVANAENLQTPLSSYARFNEIRSSGDGDDSSNAIASLLEEVASRISRLEKQITRNSRSSSVVGQLREDLLEPLQLRLYASDTNPDANNTLQWDKVITDTNTNAHNPKKTSKPEGE